MGKYLFIDKAGETCYNDSKKLWVVCVVTLQQMKYIIAIVQCGSITEAANRLYVSQPSLTNAVKSVEAEMGITIFLRSAKGITLTADGSEFLSYVRQVVEQAELLEQRYLHKKPIRQLCSVSTQHYSFAVNAFVNVISALDTEEYELTLRETRTYEIIEDVRNFRSELGLLYLSDFNEKVMTKLLKENHLEFHLLFCAEPHVFISAEHPLAAKSEITLEELQPYPCLCFEQGEYNSFYFSEEILSTVPHRKTIHVSDRATLFNLLIGLNGYTICTGVLHSNLNGNQIIAVPLASREQIRVGWIQNEKSNLSAFALRYIEELNSLIRAYPQERLPSDTGL